MEKKEGKILMESVRGFNQTPVQKWLPNAVAKTLTKNFTDFKTWRLVEPTDVSTYHADDFTGDIQPVRSMDKKKSAPDPEPFHLNPDGGADAANASLPEPVKEPEITEPKKVEPVKIEAKKPVKPAVKKPAGK